jgi:hypothetical protein
MYQNNFPQASSWINLQATIETKSELIVIHMINDKHVAS